MCGIAGNSESSSQEGWTAWSRPAPPVEQGPSVPTRSGTHGSDVDLSPLGNSPSRMRASACRHPHRHGHRRRPESAARRLVRPIFDSACDSSVNRASRTPPRFTHSQLLPAFHVPHSLVVSLAARPRLEHSVVRVGASEAVTSAARFVQDMDQPTVDGLVAAVLGRSSRRTHSRTRRTMEAASTGGWGAAYAAVRGLFDAAELSRIGPAGAGPVTPLVTEPPAGDGPATAVVGGRALAVLGMWLESHDSGASRAEQLAWAS